MNTFRGNFVKNELWDKGSGEVRDQVWLIPEVPGSPAPSSPQQPPQQGAGSSGSFSPQRARAVIPTSPRGAGWEKAALFVQLRKTIPKKKKRK